MSSDMLRDVFARFLWTLADDLRALIAMGSDDLIWLSGIVLLGKQASESSNRATGSTRVPSAYQAFLTTTNEGPKAFMSLVGALSEADKELGDALSALGPNFLAHPDPSALLTIRNALVHASLPSLGTREAQFALGDAFIDTYVRRFGRHGGELVIPRSVGHLVATLAHPAPEETTHVPFSRLGTLIVEAHRLQPSDQRMEGTGCIHGFEKNKGTWARGVLMLRLYGIPGGFTETFPSYRPPGFQPDVVMACPPFGVADPASAQAIRYAIPELANDLPEQALRDFAGVFQSLQSLGQRGRAVVVVTPGLLFRMGAVARLRAEWVKEDMLEAVITLPTGLFPGTAIATAVIVFNRNKGVDRRGKVLLFAAENLSKDRQAKKIEDEAFLQQIPRILQAYTLFHDNPSVAAVVSSEELATHDWNLSPSRYLIREDDQGEQPDFDALQASLMEAEAGAAEARGRLDSLIHTLLAER